MNIYGKVDALLAEVCMNRKELAAEIEVPYSTLSSAFAGQTKQLSADVLARISKALEVPVSFLLGTGPFEEWDNINADRTGVLLAIEDKTGLGPDLMRMLYGVDEDGAPLHLFAQMIDSIVTKVYTFPDGYTVDVKKEHERQDTSADKAKTVLERGMLEVFRRLGREQQGKLYEFLAALNKEE